MKLPEIIGIAGTNGAGKDTLAELRDQYDHCFSMSLSDMLRLELGRRGLSTERANMANLSREWRQESGDDGILAQKAIEHYLSEKSHKTYQGFSVVSLRHPAEAEAVHRYGGVVLWVDGDRRIRYERIQKATRTNRPDDLKTYEEFEAEELREMYPPTDAPAGTLNMAAVKEKADIVIENNFDTLEKYRQFLLDKFEINK
ncbi:MAG TPA: hypothetical protein VFT59_02340 [Candidatus Saccharimonadales bacterium]|nr:hypothetical protein [Candidatus Saccharimonadales bacterium]